MAPKVIKGRVRVRVRVLGLGLVSRGLDDDRVDAVADDAHGHVGQHLGGLRLGVSVSVSVCELVCVS